MTDYYIKCADKAFLDAALAEPTIMPKYRPYVVPQTLLKPQQGRAATPEGIGENGEVISAQPAVGDPNYWYCAVRTPDWFGFPNAMIVIDPAEGSQVIGGWP